MLRFSAFPALLVAATGCTGEDGARRDADPSPVSLHAFPAAAEGVPSGYREVHCPDRRRGASGLTVRLVLPTGFTSSHREADTCTFTSPADPGHAVSVRLEPDESLAGWRRTYLDPYVSEDGDDAVGAITYRDDAPGFDGATAEELRWYSYNDGSPERSVALLAAGVRLTWSVPDGEELPAAAIGVVRRSVAVLDPAGVSPGRPSRS